MRSRTFAVPALPASPVLAILLLLATAATYLAAAAPSEPTAVPHAVAPHAAAGPAPVAPSAQPAAPDAVPAGRRVVLTFDDLPLTGHPVCDPATVRRVTAALTDYLAQRDLPAAGFATPGQSCLTPELRTETYRRWREIGAVLGNHTATHPDLDATPVADYLADLDRGQRLLDAALGVPQEERWFRPPMLHSGDTAAKKRALAAHLEAEGYRLAPVTIDNQEWVYAAVYTDARLRGDRALATRVADAYLDHLEAATAYYEELSDAVLGRQVPQVLLLHANLLNADHLPRVVAMLEGRGYSFVGLPETLADPAYARRDPYVGARGLSWLQRWAMDGDEAGEPVEVPPEPREAAWVAAARRAAAERDDASDPRSRILAASAAFSRAYVEGDMETLAGLYTEDAVLLPPERPPGEPLIGPEAAARYFAPRPRRRNLAHAMRADDLRIGGDVAVDHGVWSNTWRIGDEPERHAEGAYLVVWRRGDDGRWRISHDMWHRPPG